MVARIYFDSKRVCCPKLISHSTASQIYFKFKRNIDHSDGLTKSQTSLRLVEVLDARPQRAYPCLVEVRFELASLNWSSFKPSRKFIKFWLLFDWDRVWRWCLAERCRVRALVGMIPDDGFRLSFYCSRRFKLLLLKIWDSSHNFFLYWARLLFPTALTLGVDELN